MKWSRSLIPTLREDPKNAEVLSHRLLLRGGYIRPLSSGVYNFLPTAWNILMKIATIIREEMNRIGAQEIFLPAVSPREIWDKTGRWEDYGPLMFRFKDRKKRDYALSPTHEEIITRIAAKAVRSYRQLPQTWYQIQRKYRDELRPRGGVIRAREFIMKDSYSLDSDEEGLDKNFALHRQVYKRIFDRCELNYYIIEASGGEIGEGATEEFLFPSPSGEDLAVICNCGYQANIEVATSQTDTKKYPDEELKKVHTPDKKTVEEVADFLGFEKDRLVKTMVFIQNGNPIILLIRGDRELSEDKLRHNFGLKIRAADGNEIVDYMNVPAGFVGPVEVNLPIYADKELAGATGMVTGANQPQYHITGLNLNRDTKVKEYIDIRRVEKGDRCPKCNKSLAVEKGIELGHIFKLGTKYSGPLGATFLDADGKEKPIVMGSYGIGLERIMVGICEQTVDEQGPNWPLSLAPFQASIVTINTQDRNQMEISGKIYQSCLDAGFNIIWDERDESPGVKFKDHDLVGIPIRITVGPEGMKKGKVDINIKKSGIRQLVTADEVVDKLKAIIKNRGDNGRTDKKEN